MATKKVDFRRLKEQRETLKNKKKIDSPLAKYNSSGQLFCVLCNAPIKSELLWTAHVQSRKHKENFAAIKNKTNKTESPVTEQRNQHKDSQAVFAKPSIPDKTDKRKATEASDNSEIPKKKAKGSTEQSSSRLPADFFDGPSKQITRVEQNEEDDDDDEDENSTPAVAGLPSDFFDGQSKDPTSPSTEEPQTSKRKMSEELPEGFFDDPKQDAKARKVEYKDPQDEEWEKFQKVMQMENQVSEALVEEDDEVARIDRQLTELSEQREYFLRAHTLRDKQTVIRDTIIDEAKQRREKMEEDEQNSSDSEDFEEFFDWRAKRVV